MQTWSRAVLCTLGILAVGSFLADFGSSLTHPVDFALGRLDLTCVCLSSSLAL